MRADDVAADLEQLQRDISLKYRKPQLPVRKLCYNCDALLPTLGSFCNEDCRKDFEIRQKQRAQHA